MSISNINDERNESYKQLGRFVVAFQHVESELRFVTRLLLDGDRTARADIILSKIGFKDLVEATDVMFSRFVDERNIPDGAQRKSDFHQLCKQSLKLNIRRNTLIHSTYCHLLGDNGYKGLLRQKLRLRYGGSLGSRQEDEEEILTKEDFCESISHCNAVALKLDEFRLWLIDAIYE